MVISKVAQVNVISKEDAERLNIAERVNAKKIFKLTGVTGTGEFIETEEVQVEVPGIKSIVTIFYIAPVDVPIIISAPSMAMLGLTLAYATREARCDDILIPTVYTVGLEKRNVDRITIEDIKQKVDESDIRVKEEKEELQNLLTEYHDLWSVPKAGKCVKYTVNIEVKGNPIRCRERPMSEPLLSELYKQIKEMEDSGVISKAVKAEWVSAVVMVKKPNGNYRVAIDYRPLNKLIKNDSYPLPNIHEIFKRLYNKAIFTTIDLNWGFWNIPLEEESKKYTGFVVPGRGIYVFNVLPFGLKVSPTEFQRIMHNVLYDLIQEKEVKVYIDDIVISTKNIRENLQLIQRVFGKLKENGLYINFKKTQFCKKEVKFLGHIISLNKLAPNKEKIKGIVNCKEPENRKQLQSFLGAANYFRNFIKNYAAIAEPLTSLTKERKQYMWSKKCGKAFKKIKEKMMECTFLSIPNPELGYVIFCDASDVSVGAVLAQKEKGIYKYIQMSSEVLSDTQRRWATGEKEAYAIVFACRVFDGYIRGVKTIVYSDHRNLSWMDSASQGKIYRWGIMLQEYNLDIRYIDGKKNAIADWLSRAPKDDIDYPEYMTYNVNTVWTVNFSEEEYTMPDMKDVIAEVKAEESNNNRLYITWRNGIPLWRNKTAIYIPEKYRKQFMYWFHASRYGGHCGINRTKRRMRKLLGWPNMHADVEKFIHNCPICALMRNDITFPDSKNILEKPNLFELVALDFIGPRTWYDKVYHIHVAIDHCSRFMMVDVIEGYPNAINAIALLKDKWIPVFGCPNGILTDKSAIYESSEFTAYIIKVLQIPLYHTSPYYPQGNSINESSHRLLEYAIKTSSSGSADVSFKELVEDAMLVHNLTPHEVLGESPYYVVFNKDGKPPGWTKWYPVVAEKDRAINAKHKKIYDMYMYLFRKRKNLREVSNKELKVGDLIIFKTSEYEKQRIQHFSGEKKYKPRWSFPHRIVKVTDKVVYASNTWLDEEVKQVPKTKVKICSDTAPKLLKKLLKNLLVVAQPISKEIPAQLLEEDSVENIRFLWKKRKTTDS